MAVYDVCFMPPVKSKMHVRIFKFDDNANADTKEHVIMDYSVDASHYSDDSLLCLVSSAFMAGADAMRTEVASTETVIQGCVKVAVMTTRQVCLSGVGPAREIVSLHRMNRKKPKKNRK
jgi:hypothetical protein